VPRLDRWLAALLVRTVHARSGARDTIFTTGDLQDPIASMPIGSLALAAIAIGPAPESTRRVPQAHRSS
jgi:hypothetical protein